MMQRNRKRARARWALTAATAFAGLAAEGAITNATLNVGDDKVGAQSWDDARMWTSPGGGGGGPPS